MLEEIKSLIFGAGELEHRAMDPQLRVHTAAVALLIEMAVMDGDFDTNERATIGQILEAQFGIAKEDVAELITDTEAAVKDAVDLFSFTRVLRDEYEQEERFKIIEMMWEVAYADGVVHEFESSLIRRATGLLNVSDRESGEAKKRVIERLDIGSGEA